MKNVFLSVVVVATLISAGVGGTLAGFVDTEESTGNYIQAGMLDLLVNGKNDPNVGAKLQYNCSVPCISTDFYIDLFSWSECQGAEAYMRLKNIQSVENGYKNYEGTDYVYDGKTDLDDVPFGYRASKDPTGAGVASTEPELIAEEGGGVFGQYPVGANDPELSWQENMAKWQGLGVDYASGISEHLGIIVEVCDDGSDGILDDADDDHDGFISTAEYGAHDWTSIDSMTGKMATLGDVKAHLGFLESQNYAWIHVVVHLQQIEAPDWPDEQTKYWPTNALQGDKVSWDMLFELNTDSD